MKINKKLKYTFISSLTLISSTISVVACGNKKKTDETNYTVFLTSLNNNLKGSDKQNEFLQKKSSFSKIYKDFLFDLTKKNKISILNDIKPEYTYVFDDKYQIKLSDLEYGGINIENGSITFKKDYKTINLKNAFFVSNFDIHIDVPEAFTNTKAVTYTLSSFFQLENKKDFIDLNFKDFNRTWLIERPSASGFNFTKNVKFSYDNSEQQKSPSLGIENNTSALGISNSKFPDSINWKDANNFKVSGDYYHCNVDFKNSQLLNFDNKRNSIYYYYDSVLINGTLDGTGSDSSNYMSSFFLIVNLYNLKDKKNAFFTINKKKPLVISFLKQ